MKRYITIIIRLWKILKDFHRHFYIQLSSIIFDQALGIFITLLLAKTLDSLIAKNVPMLIYILIAYPLVSFVRNRVSYYTERHSIKYIDNALQQFLQEYSFKKIFRLTISQYNDNHSAIKLQNINRGESAAEDIISTLVLTVIPVITQTLFGLIAISFYSKTVALWCFLVLLVIVVWTNIFSEGHRPFVKENIDNWDKQRKIRTEAFQHLSLIKTFAAEKSYLSKYLSGRLGIIDHSIFVSDRSNKHGHRRTMFMILARTVSMILTVRQFLTGLITTGSVFAVWSWMNDIFANIQAIVRTLRLMPIRFVELEKYLDVIDSEPSFIEGSVKDFVNGDIVFKDVNLFYTEAKEPSIKDLNLTIKSGQKVALVGTSGGGKSSLVKLLLRAYEYNSGSIQIGGTEVRDFSYTSLRSHIGYVDQHVDLFDTSVRDNILLGVDSEISEEKLQEIAKKSRITEFYKRLGDDGLDTIIGEKGIKLSGGERQRVGIARALIRNPEILIFDEATSALDTENESYIKEAIDEASKGRTTIIIAHRLSTVRDADKIIVMDQGTVVAEGTHEELLKTSSHYNTLISHQMS